MESSQTLNVSIPSGFELYGSTDSLLIDGVDRTSEFCKTEQLQYLHVMMET